MRLLGRNTDAVQQRHRVPHDRVQMVCADFLGSEVLIGMAAPTIVVNDVGGDHLVDGIELLHCLALFHMRLLTDVIVPHTGQFVKRQYC